MAKNNNQPSLLKVFPLANKPQHIYIDAEQITHTNPGPDNTTIIHYKTFSYSVGVHFGVIAKYLEPVQGSSENVKRKERDDHSRRD